MELRRLSILNQVKRILEYYYSNSTRTQLKSYFESVSVPPALHYYLNTDEMKFFLKIQYWTNNALIMEECLTIL